MTLPPEPVLLAWYRCGRKRRLDTEAVAALAAGGWPDVTHYPCGDHWHMGRTPMPGRRWTVHHARRAWVRAQRLGAPC